MWRGGRHPTYGCRWLWQHPPGTEPCRAGPAQRAGRVPRGLRPRPPPSPAAWSRPRSTPPRPPPTLLRGGRRRRT
eukprot:9104824-Alexandrium_andersonii.AAC.1